MWYVYFRRIVLAVFAVFVIGMFAGILVICNTFSVQAQVQNEELVFPFLIEGTPLVAEYFVSYEGDYFEDMSEDFVMNCAALCIYNKGDNFIEFVSIDMETLDGVYCFEGTCIPPHAKVVILEKYKSPYPQSGVCLAVGKSIYASKACVLQSIQVNAIDLGRIEICNQSNEDLHDVLLYYKRYDSQWDIYIGGVTYAVKIGDLRVGESTILLPGNYANGYSKVLYATAN